MRKEVDIPEILRCFLHPDAETGRWVGHCLDLDVVTSGKDEDKAWKNLQAAVRIHVERCFTHWREGLKFRASDDEIALFERLKEQQPVVRTEKITFNLVPPRDEQLSPLWMQGVEMTEGVRVFPAAAALQ